MSKKSYFKGFISGVLVVLLTTNLVFAATTSKSIKVTFDNIRMIFDGVEKTPKADSKPITYNGKIYVPIDFVAKSIGKNYTFDAKSKIAYVGEAKSQNVEITAKTSDGRAQLTFPKGWVTYGDLNGASILSYTNNQSVFIVFRENKGVLSDDATIEDYCSLITKNMVSNVSNPVTTEPVSLKINNYSALQFNILGEVQKINLNYFCTIIETNDSYYQLIAYTTQDVYEKNKSNFIKIVNSFKELK